MKGVVAGLLVGWGVQSGGWGGMDCANTDLREVSMVTTPAAALAFSMVLRDQPEPGGLVLFLFFSFVFDMTHPFERRVLNKVSFPALGRVSMELRLPRCGAEIDVDVSTLRAHSYAGSAAANGTK